MLMYDALASFKQKTIKFKQVFLYASIFIWLIFITLVCIFSSYRFNIPFDASTGKHIEGATLTFPIYGYIIEPFAAIGHALTSAPDPRLAAISLLIWIFSLTSLYFLFASKYAHSAWNNSKILLRSLSKGMVAVFIFYLYVLLILFLPLPAWKLHIQDANEIIVDLHSHTFASHDGLVFPEQNLQYHLRRGFNMTAFTEHNNPSGALAASRKIPSAIPGIETRTFDGHYLVALGIKPDIPISFTLANKTKIREFINSIHQKHHGVVIALSWRLKPADIVQLALMGVDGFEIVNTGHPSLASNIRQMLITIKTKYHRVLVADSDWHGWGNLLNIWTLVKTPHALNSDNKMSQLLAVIRQHEDNNVIPAVANPIEKPSLRHVIFTPLLEAFHYAQQLSPFPAVSRRFWGLLIIAISNKLKKNGYNPSFYFISSIFLLLGIGIIVGSLIILFSWNNSASTNIFPLHISLIGIGSGSSALLFAVWFGYKALFSRTT